jgi:polyhydroxybutyrate depolymerase
MLLYVPFLLAALAFAPAVAGERHELAVELPDGSIVERSYRLLLPPGIGESERVPAVLVLHDAGGDGEGFLAHFGWEATAAEARFAVIALDALPLDPGIPPHPLHNPRVWNAGQAGDRPRRDPPDDISYAVSATTTAAERHPIDPRRVYAVGFGNGGSMAQRLVMQRPEHFAGMASIAGALHARARVTRPRPAYLLFGEADPLGPLEGGTVPSPWFPGLEAPPVAHTVEAWHAGLRCPADSEPVVHAGDVTRQVWRACADETALAFVLVRGLGRNWPGTGPGPLPARIVGPASDALFAPWDIWEFFEEHRRSGG